MEYEPRQRSAALVPSPAGYTAAGTEFISVLFILALYSTCIVMTSMGSGYSLVSAAAAVPFGP